LPYSEVQGEIMTGYQDFLDKSWLAQLKKSYSVKIDRNIFEEIRKKLSNE
jgi:hypothetical protein